ncbi:MAG: hypothetical protein M3P18_23655 [Actinomycetota bacterium]|nr:hypothetical protein [Actinomycetota bacterium]
MQRWKAVAMEGSFDMRLVRVLLGMVMLGLIGFAPANSQAWSADSKFGVGVVPYLNAGDETEQKPHRAVGTMPEVDRMYNINDSTHLFQTLLNIKKSGRQINYLVIAGHGSRDTPGIKFAKDDMIPEEVDLKWNQDQLAIAQKLKQNPSATSKTPAQVDQIISDLSTRIAFLETASDVMAKDAVVLLINCSAAATPRGQKFVRDFGEALLGKRGGQIIAPKRDIFLNERNSLLQRMWTGVLEGTWVQPGDIMVKTGGAFSFNGHDWLSFPIKGSNPGSPPPATNLWAGQWSTSSGGFALRLLYPTDIEIAKTESGAAQLYDKLNCPGPQYYRGGYVDPGDRGKIIGCGTPHHLFGRWLSNDDGNAGSFDITISSTSPLKFTGWAQPDGQTTKDTWTGSWLSHFAGDGCCGAGG